MDTLLAITSRRDVRRYRSDPLGPELVNRILDAGRLSGSSKNRQAWTFVVPASRARLEALAATVYAPDNVLSAGLVVAIVTPLGKGAFDAGRAAQNMLLAAWNDGVASCPNGIRDRAAAYAALELDDDQDPVIVLSFGLPERQLDPESRSSEEWSARANRRALADVVQALP